MRLIGSSSDQTMTAAQGLLMDAFRAYCVCIEKQEKFNMVAREALLKALRVLQLCKMSARVQAHYVRLLQLARRQ